LNWERNVHDTASALYGLRFVLVREFLSRNWLAAVFLLFAASLNAAEMFDVGDKPLPKADDQRLHAAIAAHKGKPVLINFWASWCEPCREEMPSLQRLADRWRAKGLVVMTVAVADNRKLVEDYLWEIDVKLPVIHDPGQALNRPWEATILPTTLILDHRHRIRLRGQGAIDWDVPEIDQQLQALFHKPRR
jgi:thiol-disulfide isomerase/thioredoxin